MVFHGHHVRTGSIGGVACYEDYRGRGYATQTLHRCFEGLREAGASVAYISGGRGLYLRNHCVKVGREFRATVSAAALPSAADDAYEARVADPSDLDALIRVHEREPLRHVRPRSLFETAAFIRCDLPQPRWKQAIYGVWAGNEMVAYAALRCNVDSASEGQVREVAGSRSALVGVLPALMRIAGVDQLQWPVRPGDRELVALLTQQGVECTPTESAGTWRVIDFVGFMDALRPYVQERCNADLRWEGERDYGAFVLGNERLDLPDAAAAGEVLFGGVDPLDPRVMSAPPALREALTQVLPIPVPLSGLNSV